MNKLGFKAFYIAVIALVPFTSFGQELLKKEDAVKIAMANNFDIQISYNNMAVAENNASIQNSRYLPTLSGTAGANYANTDGNATQRNGEESEFENNETAGFNASIGLSYTIFDGFGRSNAYKKLQETFNITELQARLVIETAILNIFNSYYEVARLTQDVENQKQTLEISRIRLERARYSAEYGQGSQLDILNAEVDYNNDSITYLTNTQLLTNEKRNLNVLLGRDVAIDFDVDTTLSYETGLLLETLMVHSMENNVSILTQEGQLRNAEYDINTTRSNAIPKLNLNANYGWNENRFGVTGFIDRAASIGPNVGATLTWNIYDGGSTNIARQNSKIQLETQSINLDRQKLSIQRDLTNAWTAYQTALFVKQAQEKNLQTAQTNFDRSVDQYKLGQISNIVFRQAQVNLLNAQLALNQAKYTAKNAELFLLQISGDLRQAQF